MDSKNIATTGYHNDESENIMCVQRDDEQCEREVTEWMDSDIRQHGVQCSMKA